MKKLLLSTLFVLSFGFSAGAQTEVSNNNESTTTSTIGVSGSNSGYVSAKGFDISVDYNSDLEVFGFGFIADTGKRGYWGYNYSVGFGDLSSYSFIMPFGWKQRYVFNDVFLVQGKIGPYVGFSNYEKQKYAGVDKWGNAKIEIKDKYEFAYGANASLAVGLKLWTTKKGNSNFLTIGYYISAPKFKTENMFDNGSWGLSFTVIFNE